MKCSIEGIDDESTDPSSVMADLTIAEGLDLGITYRTEEATIDINKIDATIESLRLWRIAREENEKHAAIDETLDKDMTLTGFPETTEFCSENISNISPRDEDCLAAQAHRLSTQQLESESAIETIKNISILSRLRHQQLEDQAGLGQQKVGVINNVSMYA